MSKKLPILVLFFFFILINSGSAYITVGADGAPFDVNEVVEFKGYIRTNAGVDRNNVDVNVYVKDIDGNVLDENYLGDRNGFYNINYSFTDVGDYNIYAVDLNNDVNSVMTFKVLALSSLGIEFTNHNPPFEAGAETIRFRLQGKDTNGNDTNTNADGLTVKLKDSNGTDVNSFTDGNANGLSDLNFATSNLSPGTYFIDVNNGLRTFAVQVFSFKLFADTIDDSNNASGIFGLSSSPIILVRLTNLDENANLTPSSAPTVTVKKPGATSTTSVSCTKVGNSYQCSVPSSVTDTVGTYQVGVTATYSGNTQTTNKTFDIGRYELRFFAKKFTGANMTREKIPSVYPTKSTVTFELHVVDKSTGKEVTGTDLNSSFCSNASFLLKRRQSGTSTNTVWDFNANLNDQNNFCDVNAFTPSTQATYFITASMDVNSEKLSAGTSLIVQNYTVFMEPINPSTKTFAWQFFKGENIGFKPRMSDLNGSLNPIVTGITKATIHSRKGDIDLNSDVLNWIIGSDSNYLDINSAAFSSVSGGFTPVTFKVNVDASGTANDANNITAFGMFKLSVLSIDIRTAKDVNGTSKQESFGPVTYKTDENVFLKVTVKDGAGNAISGAKVSLSFLRNFDNWEEVSLTSIPTKTTDGNGITILDLNTNAWSSKSSGFYFGEISVISADGNSSDTGEAFFEVRNFQAFAEGYDPNSENSCGFSMLTKTDQNANFLVKAYDPQQWSALDVNIAGSGAVTVQYFGSPEKPQFPPTEIDINAYTTSTVNCFDGNWTRVNIEPNGKWKTGFYDVGITVTNSSKGTEKARGFFQSAAFTFTSQINFSQGTPAAKPGGTFDFNVKADVDVNIVANVIDFQMFEKKGGADLNIGFPNQDCNASGTCNNLRVEVKKGGAGNTDFNTLRVIIPSSLAVGDYMVSLTATNNQGDSAESQVFVSLQAYKTYVLGGPPFGPMYELSPTQSVDALWDVNGVEFDGVWKPDSSNSANIDFNFLVSYTNRNVIVDTDNDKNFAEETAIAVGSDINNLYRITDISQAGAETGIKYIKISDTNTTTSGNNYIGKYPKDKNFTIPILVRDVNGEQAENVTVSITNVQIYEPGNYFSTFLSSSDYNAFADVSDNNGLALPVLALSKSGTYIQVEMQLTQGSTTQKIDPWKGPSFDVLGFKVTAYGTGPVLNLVYDQNTDGVNFGENPAIVPTLIGKISEDNNADLDLDWDGNLSDVWYFIPLHDGNVLVDDDFDLNRTASSDSNSQGERNQWNEAIATQNDLNGTTNALNRLRWLGNGNHYLDVSGTDSNIHDGNMIFYSVKENMGSYNGATSSSGVVIVVQDLNSQWYSNDVNVSMSLTNYSTGTTKTIPLQTVYKYARFELGDLNSGSSYSLTVDVTEGGITQREWLFLFPS